MSDTATSKGLPEANVTIVHVPTGSRIILKTSADGRFTASNLRPGGPYTVTVAAIGYKPKQRNEINVNLGAATIVPFLIKAEATQLQEITVTGVKATDVERQVASTSVSEDQLRALPSVSRSLSDFTRLNPTSNGGQTFAGSSYRYNNLTIDGAISNDAFGFSPSSGTASGAILSGTPGGIARTQPISLDAVEQLTVQTSPYDVKIGNFTGASINAVTRAGTNETEGSIFSFGRNATITGNGLSGSLPSDFQEYQVGGRLGGALKKDKAFYFLNFELTRRTDPVLYAPGTNGALLTTAQAGQIATALDTYAAAAGYANFNEGNVSAYNIPANSEKYFARFDFNLGDKSTLTLRDNFVNASAGQFERGAALPKFASQDYTHDSKNNSFVAELKSQLSASTSNQLIASFGIVSDSRTPYSLFGTTTPTNQISPQVEITDAFGVLQAGNDRESVVYKTNTKSFELTDNLVWTKGIHTVTLGTHNELYKVQYTFANSYNGRWQYPSLARFLAQQPSRIRATYAYNGGGTADNSLAGVTGTPGADFQVFTPSGYLQDEIQLADNLKVVPGVRVDATFVDTPVQAAAFTSFTANTTVAAGTTSLGATPFAGYTNGYGSSFTVAPRLGITWNPTHSDKFAVRIGGGIFQGRMPFAWFAYPFLNNGIQFANVDFRPAAGQTVPLIMDPTQQKNVNTLYGVGNQFEINLVDNNFSMPRVWRGSAGVDFELPGAIQATLEGQYTSVIKDNYYINADLPTPNGTLQPGPGGTNSGDNRPTFAASRLAAAAGQPTNPFSAVYVLTNTDQGYRFNITGTLRKFANVGGGNSIDLYGAYTYGESYDAANGQRNSPQSNWEFNQTVQGQYPGKAAALSWSNFDVRHRIVATATFRHQWGKSASATAATLIYTGQSGSPFSYVVNGDINGDGSSNNDLIYVPKNASDINIVPTAAAPGTAAQFDSIVSADPYLSSRRGTFAERNGPRTPWNHRMDLRLLQDIGFMVGTKPQTLQLTVDVLNVTKVFGGDFGNYYFVPNLNNQNVYIMNGSRNATTNVVTYNFAVPTSTPYQVDDFLSRWQMQFGVRYSF